MPVKGRLDVEHRDQLPSLQRAHGGQEELGLRQRVGAGVSEGAARGERPVVRANPDPRCLGGRAVRREVGIRPALLRLHGAVRAAPAARLHEREPDPGPATLGQSIAFWKRETSIPIARLPAPADAGDTPASSAQSRAPTAAASLVASTGHLDAPTHGSRDQSGDRTHQSRVAG